MQYTYKLVNIRTNPGNELIDHKELLEQLNNAGQEGYRFVGKQVDYRGFVAIMEKERPEWNSPS